MAEALGLKYPRDYSIVGFDDIWLAALSEFDFTTIAQDRKGIGRISMELLLERVNGGVAEDIILPPRLVVRGSTSQYGI
jgi:DNA-binding LacI/PurR family transcriptional regulator